MVREPIKILRPGSQVVEFPWGIETDKKPQESLFLGDIVVPDRLSWEP